MIKIQSKICFQLKASSTKSIPASIIRKSSETSMFFEPDSGQEKHFPEACSRDDKANEKFARPIEFRMKGDATDLEKLLQDCVTSLQRVCVSIQSEVVWSWFRGGKVHKRSRRIGRNPSFRIFVFY